jgi:hypothetical protein
MQYNMADNVFENNIVYAGAQCLMTANKSPIEAGVAPVRLDHNLYYCASGAKASAWGEISGPLKGFDSYVQSTKNDAHSQFLDPRFLKATESFHLLTGSPAIGAGVVGDLPVGDLDLAGAKRVKSGKIDLGCYQSK